MPKDNQIESLDFLAPNGDGTFLLFLPRHFPPSREQQLAWLAMQVRPLHSHLRGVAEAERLAERLQESQKLVEAFIELAQSKALCRELELRLIRRGVYSGPTIQTIAIVEQLDDYRTDHCQHSD